MFIMGIFLELCGKFFVVSCRNIVIVSSIVIFSVICLLDLGGRKKFNKIMDMIIMYGIIKLKM